MNSATQSLRNGTGTAIMMRVLVCASIVALTVTGAASSAQPGVDVFRPGGTIGVVDPSDFRTVLLISPSTGAVARVRTPDTVIGQQADLSSDGKRIVFAGSRGIWTLSRTGGSARRVVAAPPSATFVPDWVAWSPSTRQIVFTRAEALFVVGANGNRLRRLPAGRAYAPDWWSPANIVYVQRPSPRTGAGRISSIGADGSGVHPIVRGGHPDVSSDGSLLAFERSDGLYVMPRRGGKARRIVSAGDHPEWSPDGRYLAFTRDVKCGDAGCESRVFIVRAEGGEARPVGPRIFEAGPLSWSS